MLRERPTGRRVRCEDGFVGESSAVRPGMSLCLVRGLIIRRDHPSGQPSPPVALWALPTGLDCEEPRWRR